MEVLSLLRQENIALKEQLERQNDSILNQAEALNKMSSTSNGNGSYNHDECVRLSAELDKCLDEKEALQQKFINLETKNAVMMKHLLQLCHQNQVDVVVEGDSVFIQSPPPPPQQQQYYQSNLVDQSISSNNNNNMIQTKQTSSYTNSNYDAKTIEMYR